MRITESQMKLLVRKMVKEAVSNEEKLATELEKIENQHQAELKALEARKQRAIELAQKKWSPEEVNRRAERAKVTYSPEAMATRKAEKDTRDRKSKEIYDSSRALGTALKKCATCGKELSTSSELSRYQYNAGPHYCDDHNKGREKAYSAWRAEGNEKGFS